MSYSCPECTDGTLEAKVRELDLELEDGEKATIIGGVAVITRVACDNGCSAEDEEEEKPKTRKKRAPAVHGEPCLKSDLCDKASGHPYRCNSNLAAKESE